jgi:hypothetical protein
MDHVFIHEISSNRRIVSLDDFARDANRARERRELSFALGRTTLVAEFADKLNRGPEFKREPSLRAFAFWIRKGAIEQLRTDFIARLPRDCVCAGRGLAFHLPPANVDTIFLYSWVLSFLAGNVNITRLPSQLGTSVALALDTLIALLRRTGYNDSFLSYAASEPINRTLSGIADFRLVWGGNEKARAFECLPLRIDGRALVFPDRFSYSVMSGEYLQSLTPDQVAELARKFHNDLFVFNQMACSSPHILYVVGSSRQAAAVDRLVLAVAHTADQSGTTIEAAHAIQKFTAANVLAGEGHIARGRRYSNAMTVVELMDRVSPQVGGGFVSVCYVDQLDDLIDLVQERDQTLVYAGFSKETMSQFARKVAPKGLCRIVPVGRALDFDVIWDGQDLMMEAVRQLRVL